MKFTISKPGINASNAGVWEIEFLLRNGPVLPFSILVTLDATGSLETEQLSTFIYCLPNGVQSNADVSFFILLFLIRLIDLLK